MNRSTLACHIRRMANGQVVLITTEQLGERPVTRTVYYVAEEDPVKATAIIARLWHLTRELSHMVRFQTQR